MREVKVFAGYIHFLYIYHWNRKKFFVRVIDYLLQFHFNFISKYSKPNEWRCKIVYYLLLYNKWRCIFAPGICMNSGLGKKSPARMSFPVQNEPKVLSELFSPLSIQSCSYPLAKNMGLHFLLMKMHAAPLTLVSRIITFCKELDGFICCCCLVVKVPLGTWAYLSYMLKKTNGKMNALEGTVPNNR